MEQRFRYPGGRCVLVALPGDSAGYTTAPRVSFSNLNDLSRLMSTAFTTSQAEKPVPVAREANKGHVQAFLYVSFRKFP